MKKSDCESVQEPPGSVEWLVESAYSPSSGRAQEGLFTQGSGYLHVRGSLEEHFTDAPQNTTYLRMPGNVTAEKFPATQA